MPLLDIFNQPTIQYYTIWPTDNTVVNKKGNAIT